MDADAETQGPPSHCFSNVESTKHRQLVLFQSSHRGPIVQTRKWRPGGTKARTGIQTQVNYGEGEPLPHPALPRPLAQPRSPAIFSPRSGVCQSADPHSSRDRSPAATHQPMPSQSRHHIAGGTRALGPALQVVLMDGASLSCSDLANCSWRLGNLCADRAPRPAVPLSRPQSPRGRPGDSLGPVLGPRAAAHAGLAAFFAASHLIPGSARWPSLAAALRQVGGGQATPARERSIQPSVLQCGDMGRGAEVPGRADGSVALTLAFWADPFNARRPRRRPSLAHPTLEAGRPPPGEAWEMGEVVRLVSGAGLGIHAGWQASVGEDRTPRAAVGRPPRDAAFPEPSRRPRRVEAWGTAGMRLGKAGFQVPAPLPPPPGSPRSRVPEQGRDSAPIAENEVPRFPEPPTLPSFLRFFRGKMGA
ncbi:hypothetical protein P7K49_011986 [Saguinus oedipus]|uniref:Uncharacterized protein n=1 Tax=Saguinus oedipus TaxID=9490 RepID=A0ABQ9VTR9_SAGOE|nr:hypothetical protein P7K49_011986 [Saguinus oedipus]